MNNQVSVFTISCVDPDTLETYKQDVRVRAFGNFLEILPAGYGEKNACLGDGAPVFLDLYERRLTVHICSDINVEGPTFSHCLEGAREVG